MKRNYFLAALVSFLFLGGVSQAYAERRPSYQGCGESSVYPGWVAMKEEAAAKGLTLTCNTSPAVYTGGPMSVAEQLVGSPSVALPSNDYPDLYVAAPLEGNIGMDIALFRRITTEDGTIVYLKLELCAVWQKSPQN